MPSHGARRRLAALLAIAIVLPDASPALAYLKFGFAVNETTQVTLQWKNFPVPYYISNTPAANISVVALQAAVGLYLA